MIKDENENLLGDMKSILNRWKNYFNNVLNINDREQDSFNENTIHTAEPFIVEPDELDIKFIIEELKSHKAPGIDGIPAELIKSGGPSLCAAVHKLILAIWRQEKLPREWKESIIIPIHKKGEKTNCSNFRGISLLPTCYKILSKILLKRLNIYAKEIIGDYQCGFRPFRSTMDPVFCIRQILEKKWEFGNDVYQLFIDFKKAYDSIKREKLYNIMLEFGIPKKLVRLVRVCMSDTFSRVRIGKDLSDEFCIRNGLKQGDSLSPVLFNITLE